VPEDRLFIVATRLEGGAGSTPEASSAAASGDTPNAHEGAKGPRVDFSLR